MKTRSVMFVLFLILTLLSGFLTAQTPEFKRPGELTIEEVRVENPFQKGDPKYTVFDGIIVFTYELALRDGLSKHAAATHALNEFNLQLGRYVTGEEPVIPGTLQNYRRSYGIKTAEYRSIYDDRDAETKRAEIEEYFGKRSLLNDTLPPRFSATNDYEYIILESGDVYYSTPEDYHGATDKLDSSFNWKAQKDVLLVSYYIKNGFGVSDKTGSIIVVTDALRKDIIEGASPSPLLDDLIYELQVSGILTGRLDRPKASSVTLLGYTYVGNTNFIYSTAQPAWQRAQTPRK